MKMEDGWRARHGACTGRRVNLHHQPPRVRKQARVIQRPRPREAQFAEPPYFWLVGWLVGLKMGDDRLLNQAALDNFTNPQAMRRVVIPQCHILTLLRKHPKTLHDDDPRLADVAHVLAGGSYSDRLICTAYCASIMSLSAPPFRRTCHYLVRPSSIPCRPPVLSLLAHPPG